MQKESKKRKIMEKKVDTAKNEKLMKVEKSPSKEEFAEEGTQWKQLRLQGWKQASLYFSSHLEDIKPFMQYLFQQFFKESPLAHENTLSHWFSSLFLCGRHSLSSNDPKL